MKVVFQTQTRTSYPKKETSDAGLSKPSFNASLSNSSSNTGLKNPASRLKHKSEQPHVPFQMQV